MQRLQEAVDKEKAEDEEKGITVSAPLLDVKTENMDTDELVSAVRGVIRSPEYFV